jgi:hypothetical protein
MIVGGFPVPTSGIERMLPSNKLKPVKLMPGKGAIALVAKEYGRIDGLAPYNEFTIMVSVTHDTVNGDPGLHGYYILHQYVTTEEARQIGVEVYGYPTVLADITFEDEGEVRRCRVLAEGKDIITLQVKKLATDPLPWDMDFFSVKGGQFLRSCVQGSGQQGISGNKGEALFTLGNHPAADKLRALNTGKLSVLHRYAPHWQSIVHPPGEHLPL